MSDDFPPPVSHMPTTPGPALSLGDAAAVRAICRLALNRVMEVNLVRMHQVNPISMK